MVFEVVPLLLRVAAAGAVVLAAIQAESSLPGFGCLSISVCVYFYLFFVRYFWVVPSLCVAAQVLCLHYNYLEQGRILSYVPFLLNAFLVLLDTKSVNDTEPTFGKCEREIRQIFWRHNPAELHRVDQMLKDNKGKELALLHQCRRYFNLPDDTVGDVLGRGLQDDPVEPSVEEIRKMIVDMLRLKDPSKERYVDKLMTDYRGRERQLVEELFREYRVSLPPRLATASSQRGSYEPWVLQQERVLEEEKIRAREAVSRNLSSVGRR